MRGAATLRPLAAVVRKVEQTSRVGGVLALLPGERALTDRLRQLLGLPASDHVRGDGLLVHPAGKGSDHAAAATALAAHKEADGRSLALLVGRRGERTVKEQAFLARGGLELGDLAHVPSLDGDAGARGALDAVVEALGDNRIAAARLTPALRAPVADLIVDRAARQAATIGGMIFLPGADLPVITALQMRLVVELAAVYDRPLGTDRLPEVAAVFGAGFGFRALVRSTLGSVPGPGWALRAGLGYAATKAVGQAARAWYADAGDLAEHPVEDLRERIEGLVRRARAARARAGAAA